MTHPDHSGHHNADGEPVVARQRLPVHLVGQEDVAPGVDRSAGRTLHEMRWKSWTMKNDHNEQTKIINKQAHVTMKQR